MTLADLAPDSEGEQTERGASELARLLGGVLLTPIASAGLLVLPIYVGGLIEHAQMSAQDALFVVSMDMWGMAAALPLAYICMRLISWRLLGVATLTGIFAFFALPALAYADGGEDVVGALALWRFLGGISSGMLMAVILATLGSLRIAERAFSIWVLVQILFKVVAIYVLALVLAEVGLQGFFLVLGALAIVGIPLAWTLPRDRWTTRESATANWSGKAIMSLAGLITFYIALSALWANFETVGRSREFDILDIAAVLSVTSLAGLAGATASTVLTGRVKPLYRLIGGIAIIAGASFALGRPGDLTVYTVIGTAFAFAWFFTVPVLLSMVNANDRSGRLMIFANAAIAMGVAAGPAISAVFVSDNDYTLLSMFSTVAFVFVFLLMLPSNRRLAS